MAQPMHAAPGCAVITGAAGAIGAATARLLAAAGSRVVLLDVEPSTGARLAQELGAGASFHVCDVGDAAAVEHVAEALDRSGLKPDVLVSCAALIPNAESVMAMDLQSHQRQWQVNYFGTLHACRSFGRRMAEAGRGSIVTLGSINSFLPLPLPAYNPAKAALARLTALLAAELGAHGVRVNSVAPTYVMTEALRQRVDAGLRDPERMMALHALPHLPTPEDVAQAVAFLCGDAARCITGVTLPVDSGWAAAVSYKTYAGGVPDTGIRSVPPPA